MTGRSGVGKSTLAAVVSHEVLQAGAFSSGVVWLDGGTLASYQGMLAALAQQLGLPLCLPQAAAWYKPFLL